MHADERSPVRDADCRLTADAVVVAARPDGTVDLEFAPHKGCEGCRGTCLWKRLAAMRLDRLVVDRDLAPGNQVSVEIPAEPLLFSAFAVLTCLVYVHLPFMVLPLYANLEKHDQALLDAAQDLGANAWHRFWRITFPLSLPGVYAGAALVFIPALGIFAIPDILGGPDDTLIGNLIKQQFLETRDWPFGSVLSIVLTLSALLPPCSS